MLFLPRGAETAASAFGIPEFVGKDEIRRFLNNMGFVEQESVQIISEFGGNLIVAVKGARVAVSRAMASWILVR